MTASAVISPGTAWVAVIAVALVVVVVALAVRSVYRSLTRPDDE